jgi:hypothetical protein
VSTADSQNPFCPGPIRLPAQFFGREKETRHVLKRLNQGESVSIVGPRKIGKTSLLFHVARPYVRGEQGLAEEHIFSHLDCYSLDGFRPGECYLRIREAVIQQIKKTESVDKAVGIELEKAVRRASASGGTEYFGLSTLFRGAQKNNLKLVIVLDHLDILAQSSCLDSDFFSALRALAMGYEASYLVASWFFLENLERIRPEVSSPFFNFFHTVRLPRFTSEESHKLVVELLKHVQVEFPECVTDCILELGNNKPCHLQRAGHIAFQVWQENQGNLGVEHCGQIQQRFERET